MVALDPPLIKLVPLSDAVTGWTSVPLDGDTICTARELGVCMGD